MANKDQAQEETQSLTELRDGINCVWIYGDSLDQCADRAQGKSSGGRCWPSQADFDLAESGESLAPIPTQEMTRDEHGQEEVTHSLDWQHEARCDWARLLRRIQSDLGQFYTAWDKASSALDRLPKHFVDDERLPVLERWSTRLRALLQDVIQWLYFYRSCGGIDAGRFVYQAAQRPADWKQKLLELYQFDRNLQAVQNSLGICPSAQEQEARAPATTEPGGAQKKLLFALLAKKNRGEPYKSTRALQVEFQSIVSSASTVSDVIKSDPLLKEWQQTALARKDLKTMEAISAEPGILPPQTTEQAPDEAAEVNELVQDPQLMEAQLQKLRMQAGQMPTKERTRTEQAIDSIERLEDRHKQAELILLLSDQLVESRHITTKPKSRI